VNRVTGYVNLSGEWEHIAHKKAYERRFPCTRRSNKEGKFATVECQADASKRDMSARVTDAHVVQRDDWRFAFSHVCHIDKTTHHQAHSL
jgi:hypothetical protein